MRGEVFPVVVYSGIYEEAIEDNELVCVGESAFALVDDIKVV